MAITVTPTYLNRPNYPKILPAVTGTSTVSGTTEEFEFVIPCKDEASYIIVQNGANGNVNVSVRIMSTPEGTYTSPVGLTVNKCGCIRIDSAELKDSDGKIVVSIEPLSGNTLSANGTKVYCICGFPVSY